MRLLSRILFALSVLVGAAQAQWVKVASEGDTIKATATVRYGVTNCATCWVQLAVSGQFTASNTFFKTDPAPGVVKELDVLQTSVQQTVVVNGVAKIIPALSTPVVTPPVTTTSKTCTVPAQTIPVTINADGSFTANLSGLVVTCK